MNLCLTDPPESDFIRPHVWDLQMISELDIRVAQIGPVHITVYGDGPVSERVAGELEAFPVSRPPAETDLEVRFLGAEAVLPGYSPKIYSAKALMNFDDESFFIGYHRNFRYLIRNPFSPGRITLFVIPKRRPSLSGAYYTPRRLAESLMTYGLFWYVFQLALLKQGATFLHAGVFASEDEGVALTGTGGSGKTSVLFHLLDAHPKMRYLSEDFGILESEGFAHFNPKHVSVYGTDTRQRLLARFIREELPAAQRVPWAFDRVVLRKNPRVKVPPRQLLGADRLGDRARLKRAYFMIRGEFPSLRIRSVSQGELVERSLHVTCREMKSLLEYCRLISANKGAEMPFPSPEELVAKIRSVYEAALSRTDCYVLEIPAASGPAEVVEAILPG